MNYQLHHGDCLEVLKTMADNSVDSIVTDPPYGLSFMGKKWDYDVPSEDVWRECLRVLKPGGHLLAFAGTRTQHRMAVRIEDAGFEIRDMIAWVYSTGFPKSLDVSKAIDKAAGAERDKVPATGGLHKNANLNDDGWSKIGNSAAVMDSCTAATEAAKKWQGWGTALKPALEPITVARKPLGEKTVAANVLAHGTGAINVDGCRVECKDKAKFPAGTISDTEAVFGGGAGRYASRARTDDGSPNGRWPANLIHDGSEEVVAGFPQSKSSGGIDTNGHNGQMRMGRTSGNGSNAGGLGDSGSAARFFYCAKASKKDRDEGCEGLEKKRPATHIVNRQRCAKCGGWTNCGPTTVANRPNSTCQCDEPELVGDVGRVDSIRNHHPTVKPTALMRYLCRLVTQPGGVVLDPFMGSGSTGKAAVLEGFQFIGIERDAEYLQIAKARIEREPAQKQLL
jgi:site-specific DNA-methyltransferase (adenine-specific)